MSAYKLCPNGHHFAQDATACPYCPKPAAEHPQTAPTMQNLDKTQIVSPGLDQTQLVQGTAPAGGGGNLAKTQIVGGPGPTAQTALNQTIALRPANGRKLVGWLMSYTLDPLGVDFKLFEGKNLIGSDPKCDIVLPDSAISGHHLTILFRLNNYDFKDEFSSNGTFINDEFQKEGHLNDGDVVRVGNTLLLFRAAK
jgi:Inner membrane component of T3SS, cytoplasmic domain